MYNLKKTALIFIILIAVCIQPSLSSAGLLNDWVTAYPTTHSAYYHPQKVYYHPRAAYSNPGIYTTYSAGWFSGWSQPRTVAGYVPETRYRFGWSRVPTTVYRPITSYDPTTGVPVAAMTPCTTWRWRLGRVPYTTYRPVYSSVVTSPACCNICGTVGCTSCASDTSYGPSPTPTPADPQMTEPPLEAVPADKDPELDPSGFQNSASETSGTAPVDLGKADSSSRIFKRYPPIEPAASSKLPPPIPIPNARPNRKNPAEVDRNKKPENRTAQKTVRRASAIFPIFPQRVSAKPLLGKPKPKVTKRYPGDSGWRPASR